MKQNSADTVLWMTPMTT